MYPSSGGYRLWWELCISGSGGDSGNYKQLKRDKKAWGKAESSVLLCFGELCRGSERLSRGTLVSNFPENLETSEHLFRLYHLVYCFITGKLKMCCDPFSNVFVF